MVPAMIDTTDVLSETNGFNPAPASRKYCGFTATTSVSTVPAVFTSGLSATPLAASALISGERYGSITATRRGSSPPESHPVSIAPPILPAPASRMVPVMFWRVLLLVIAAATNSVSSRRRPGPITTSGFSGWKAEQQASRGTAKSRGMGPGSALRSGQRYALPRAALVRDDVGEGGGPYASPTVSNIAASIASVVVLPAHTTNWNAGK